MVLIKRCSHEDTHYSGYRQKGRISDIIPDIDTIDTSNRFSNHRQIIFSVWIQISVIPPIDLANIDRSSFQSGYRYQQQIQQPQIDHPFSLDTDTSDTTNRISKHRYIIHTCSIQISVVPAIDCVTKLGRSCIYDTKFKFIFGQTLK